MISPVVDLAWWRQNGSDAVLADVRWYLDGRSGREAFEAAHLPGAVWIDLDRWLAAPGGPDVGRHPLPDPETFARGMAQAGIADGSTVVAYDDAGGVIAARLVWMLRALGHDAALLDGGLLGWDGPLETGPATAERAAFTARPWPADRLATIDDAADPAHVVLDARPRERYLGEGPDPVDPRAGHIPGARSFPCRDQVGPDGRLVAVPELRGRFAAAGVDEGSSVVAYCGSGVTACHDLLALELAGFAPGRLFPGSWSQYSHEPSRPVEVGEGPRTPPVTRE